MERKYIKAVGGRLKIGCSCLIISAGFLFMGLNILFQLEEVPLLGAFVSLIGLGTGIAGLRSLVGAYQTSRKIKELVRQNQYVWAEITACQEKRTVGINNSYPRYVVARYTDAAGRTRTFESEATFRTAVKYVVGLSVRVYLGRCVDDYYVDIEGLLEA